MSGVRENECRTIPIDSRAGLEQVTTCHSSYLTFGTRGRQDRCCSTAHQLPVLAPSIPNRQQAVGAITVATRTRTAARGRLESSQHLHHDFARCHRRHQRGERRESVPRSSGQALSSRTRCGASAHGLSHSWLHLQQSQSIAGARIESLHSHQGCGEYELGLHVLAGSNHHSQPSRTWRLGFLVDHDAYTR